MLIFVAFCYLCCLPSISVDASLAPKNLQSFTRKKREDETSHRREENSVGERKKTNKLVPFYTEPSDHIWTASVPRLSKLQLLLQQHLIQVPGIDR